MNYDEYIKMIPKETYDFVNLALKLIDFYIIDDNKIVIENIGTIDGLESKIFTILLFVNYHQGYNNLTNILLNEYQIKPEFINFDNIKDFENYDVDYNKVFGKTVAIFMPFVFEETYIFLTSQRIIYEYYNKFSSEIALSRMFSKSQWYTMFNSKYSAYLISLEDDLLKPKKLDFYKDLSYNVVSYLNKAAQIFKHFQMCKADKYNNIIKTEEDFTVASLLLSIYFSEDSKMLSFFESIGLKKDFCKSKLLNDTTIKTCEERYFYPSLLKYFKRYLDDGLNKAVAKKDLTVEKIISNIFDRNFTNSFVTEIVLNDAGLSLSDFSDFENKVKAFEEEYEFIERQKKMDKFFGGTPNETIEFVYFASKVHQFIKTNMNNKCKKYINDESDISAISFFISSYFKTNDFIPYFKANGISKEKVLNIFGLNLKKEEIESIEVDVDLIINNYSDIVFGYTSDKEKVDINAVLFSLGNCQKIKSSSILKLVKDINPDIRISDNFINLVKDYKENQESIRKYTLEQKFFGNMQEESIEFVKKASQVYQALEKSDKTTPFTRDDLVEIAIFYTAIQFYDTDECDYLNQLKKVSIGDTLSIRYVSDYKDNIDIIYNLFGKYIFGGKNKGKDKSEITIRDIYTNIFNKNINNSIALYKFLNDIGFNYEKFINFDEVFADYLEQSIINKVKQSINGESKKNYFENLSQIYKCLLNMAKEGKLVYNINDNIEEIKSAARLLSILISEHTTIEKYLLLLSKRGINLENYLRYLNISLDDFNKYKKEEIDYLLIEKEFREYNSYHDYLFFLREQSARGIISIIKEAFKEHDNGYLYGNFIKFMNQSPEIVAKEMDTGEEVIIPLSKEERINKLMTMPTATIDDDLKSVFNFGRELTDYALVIADEFVDIAINDSGNERVLDIQGEITKLSRKPSIFTKKKPLSEKIAYNKAILDNLNDVLKENETRMIEVIEHLGYLKKLIATYIYRVNEYNNVLQTAIDYFEKSKTTGLKNIDNETLLQTLNDRLKDYQGALIISVGQYQKVSTLLKTYYINLNRTSNARNTTIPNLYIELSIRDSIAFAKESLSDLENINALLDNIVTANNQVLENKTLKIKGKNNEVPKELIDSIRKELETSDLIATNTDDEKDDNSKPFTKKI